MREPAAANSVSATVVPIRDADALLPRVPGYRFQKRLGQGGMATVFLAVQESLDRPVCVKVMDRVALADETSMQRFENEARTIAKLSHPNIVAIYEVGRTDDGRLYYIMPYLPNGDLTQRDLGDDDRRILDALTALLSALGYAHARGVVHRDVKRENVLFDADDRPMLADFGIALSTSDDARITRAGIAVGSSGYMAPEQARGDVVDGRADLYSVGVLTYELLTGELPFQATDALALALMHYQSTVPTLPPAKRHWQGFIDRAMAKTADKRYANAQQMIDALEPVGRRLARPGTTRVLRATGQSVEGSRWKRPWIIAIGTIVVLAGGLFAALHQSASLPAAPARKPATTAAPAVASKASPAAASPATSDAASSTASSSQSSSAASDGQDASSSSSSTKPAHAHHAAPRRAKPRQNFIKRFFHQL